MGSEGTPSPWGPYDANKDCSQGICSIYCPQWCYVFFPPPPNSFDPEDIGDSNSTLSPLIIAVISILASAFLLVGYYTIISKYCRRRNSNQEHDEVNLDQLSREQWQVAAAGLDETLIKSITVCKYKKGEGLVEGTDCAVCLSEFQEEENLRLLPKCSHAFHLPCIDTWLKSHSTCPLCRANINVSSSPSCNSSSSSSSNPSTTPSNPQNSTVINVSVSSLEIQNQENDRSSAIEEENEERFRQEGIVFNLANYDVSYPKNTIGIIGERLINVQKQQLRRSISLGSFPCQRQLLIADILKIDENEEDYSQTLRSSGNFSMETGCSNGFLSEQRKMTKEMMRTVSTGRFMIPGHGKGKNSIFPN